MRKPGRIDTLLEKCADNFERGCDALNTQFLCENEVTIDECQTLANQMAVAIKGFVRTPLKERLPIIIRACADSRDEAEQLVLHWKHSREMGETVARLSQLSADARATASAPSPAGGEK